MSNNENHTIVYDIINNRAIHYTTVRLRHTTDYIFLGYIGVGTGGGPGPPDFFLFEGPNMTVAPHF